MPNAEISTDNVANGGTMNITNDGPVATYNYQVMNADAFEALAADWRCTALGDTYSHVEYLNSPSGLIVLAHHDDINGQVDGIHPANLSHSIESPNNIIETLKDWDDNPFINLPVPYHVHWMTRRSQGGLVLAGFGRMIDGGDEEAPCIKAADDEPFSVSIYDAPSGPVVGIFTFKADLVHMIRAVAVANELQEAA